MANDAISKLLDLMAQKAEVESKIRHLKMSGEYATALHEIVDRAPGLVTVQWRKLRHMI